MRLDRETLEHYLMLDEWSAKEAALIILGFHPEAMKGQGINIGASLDAIPPEFHEVAKLYQVFKRGDWSQYDINYYRGKLHPSYFVLMANDKRIVFDEVAAAGIEEWWRNIRRKPGTESSDDGEAPLRQSERESLYKIVIGWAIGLYGYNPAAKRNPSLAEMRKDIERAGLSIDDDTLRKWLKEAAAVLPGS